jgi:pyruvate dehydrogenase E1 component beta subunit
MVQAINLALHEEMERDESVVLLGEDIGPDEGVFRVTAGLWKKFGARRVLDTPLAESGIVGAAIGMALGGLRPVAEIQFSGFSMLALPQLEGNASRYRSRTQGRHSVPMVVRMPYGGGVRALEHHSESKEAIFGHIPGLRVVIPSTPRNARALLLAAIRDPDPVVFMEPKHSYRAFKEEVPEEPEVMPLGKAHVALEGEDLTLVVWGALLRPALAAAQAVRDARGARVEVLDLLSINPLDGEAIAASVKKTGRCVVAQEAARHLGLGSEVIARINDEALMYLEAPVGRLTHFDVVTPYFGRELSYMPNAARIEEAVLETLDF